MIDVTQCY